MPESGAQCRSCHTASLALLETSNRLSVGQAEAPDLSAPSRHQRLDQRRGRPGSGTAGRSIQSAYRRRSISSTATGRDGCLGREGAGRSAGRRSIRLADQPQRNLRADSAVSSASRRRTRPWAGVVAGSSPAAPTNYFSMLQTLRFRAHGACKPPCNQAEPDRCVLDRTGRGLAPRSCEGTWFAIKATPFPQPSAEQRFSHRLSNLSIAVGSLLVHRPSGLGSRPHRSIVLPWAPIVASSNAASRNTFTSTRYRWNRPPRTRSEPWFASTRPESTGGPMVVR